MEGEEECGGGRYGSWSQVTPRGETEGDISEGKKLGKMGKGIEGKQHLDFLFLLVVDPGRDVVHELLHAAAPGVEVDLPPGLLLEARVVDEQEVEGDAHGQECHGGDHHPEEAGVEELDEDRAEEEVEHDADSDEPVEVEGPQQRAPEDLVDEEGRLPGIRNELLLLLCFRQLLLD